MAMSGGKDDGSPMMEMNTTPLIDVMLVLLIMFIITIPVQNHALPIDLPAPSDVPSNIDVDPIKNKIFIDPTDQVQWNGNAIDDGQLVTLLQQTTGMTPSPELQFEPHPQARYDRVQAILKIVKDSGVGNFGFVGNEQYRNFEASPINPIQS